MKWNWNWFRNIISRKIKSNNNNNSNIEKSLDITGIEVDCDSEFKGGVGGIHTKYKKTPAIMTEKLAVTDAINDRTVMAIEGIDDYSKREEYKYKYIDKLLEQQPYCSAPLNPLTTGVPNSRNKFDCNSLNAFLSKMGFKDLFLPNNLCNGGTLLWPMNIQDDITYIHIAQYNIARLFIEAGWNLKVIIGDCGHNATSGNPNVKKGFTESLNNFFTGNNLDNNKYSIIPLSDYFMREGSSIQIEIEHADLLRQFHIICESVLWRDYKNEILKEYDDETKIKIEDRKLLNNIQPLLIWSVVAAINHRSASSSLGKVVVLAGQDEFKQWERIVDTNRRNNLGAVFIQELKTAEGKTMDQSETKISSQSVLKEKLNSNRNLAKWLFLHFIELPSYGKTKESFSFCELAKSQCKSYNGNCMECLFKDNNYDTHFNKDRFIEYMYPLINSAN